MSDQKYVLVPVKPTQEWVANLKGVRIGSMESVIEDVLAAAPQAPAVQGELVAWKEPAANWLREKAAAQQALNEQYPEHAKCYPTWGNWVLKLNWLADELSVGVALQPAEQAVETSPALGTELDQPQYTAGDMASAAAQGFRDGQAAALAPVVEPPVCLVSESAFNARLRAAGWTDTADAQWTGAERLREELLAAFNSQTAPDVAGLVEALVAILEHDSPINIVDTATSTERDIFDIARKALAAHAALAKSRGDT